MPHQVSPAMAKKLGGKRRKTVKKSASKRGGYYGFAGDLGHPGAANWISESEIAPEVAGRGGNTTGGRRRKSKKGGKKTRKVKRGGLRFGQASAGFTGVGTARGLGGYQDVSAPGGKAEFGSFADNGSQPGSGFGSFITTSK